MPDDDRDDDRDLFGNPLKPTVAYARKTDPATAKTAARKISFTDMQARAFQAYKATRQPMTSLCVTRWLIDNGGLSDERQAWSISPRIPELVRLGAIVPADTKTVMGTNGKPSVLQAHVIHPDFVERAPPTSTPPIDPTPVEKPPTNAYYDEQGRLLNKGCAICGKSAAFGVGVFLRKELLGMWYCLEHRYASQRKLAVQT